MKSEDFDKYYFIKLVVKPKPKWIPGFIYQKICFWIFGINIKTKEFSFTWTMNNYANAFEISDDLESEDSTDILLKKDMVNAHFEQIKNLLKDKGE